MTICVVIVCKLNSVRHYSVLSISEGLICFYIKCMIFFFIQNPQMKQKYMELKEVNNNMNRRFEQYKQELDHLQMRKNELEDVRTYF